MTLMKLAMKCSLGGDDGDHVARPPHLTHVRSQVPPDQSYHHPFHMCTVITIITMIRMITAVCGIRGSHKSKFLGGRVVRRCCPGFPQGKLRLCLGDGHLTKMGAPAKGKDCHLAMQAEMQKVADPADISVLFFSAGANFWAI